MKNVLLLVHDDAGQEARLQAALDITRALDGHLQCLDVSQLPAMADCPYDGVGQALLLQDERVREDENKTKLKLRLVREDVRWDWFDATGSFAGCIRDEAAFADLILLNRKLDSFPYPDMRETATEVVIKAGKPIVAVPDEAKGFPVTGRALVAWDGSAIATAALQAAVPLLQLAGSVVILEIDDGSIVTPAEEAAIYLARYDIHARIVRDFAVANPTCDILLLGVEIQRADYVVMGAYSHMRATEAVFGGCSRAMLTKSPVPVFLAR
jgi:nucleotide-binding universal stress UspA family protein